jgi:hypothetical protein
MAETLVSSLRPIVPTTVCEMAIVFRSADCAFFAYRVVPLSNKFSLLLQFLHTTNAMARKRTAGDKRSARANANGYPEGAHRDEDVFRIAISM